MKNEELQIANTDPLGTSFTGKLPYWFCSRGLSPWGLSTRGSRLLFLFLNIIACSLCSSDAISQSGSLLLSRPLPVQNENLGRPGENPNRSNIRWFNARPINSGDAVAIGDDFTIGNAGERYLVNSLQVWIVTLATQDSDPANPDIRNSHPSLSLLAGKVASGPAGIQTLLTGTTGSSAISFSRARYENQESYWTLPSGRDEPMWLVTFKNLNWTVDGGQKYQFLISGTPVITDGGTTQVSVGLHASNAALSGAVQQSADNLYRIARLVSGVTQEVETKNSDPLGVPGTLANGGWNKSSDINVAVFGDQLSLISGTVVDRSQQAVGAATVAIGSFSTVTAPDGSFSFPSIPAGTYTLSASRNGVLFGASNFTNPLSVSGADRTGLVLTESNFSISGSFTCDPIGGINVTAGTFSAKSVFGQGFKLTGLAPGTYTVSANYPGISFTSQNITITSADETSIKLVARPASIKAPEVTLSGSTTTFSFAKFAGYEVVYLVRLKDPHGKIESYLTSKNPMQIKNLARGDYRIKVQAGIGPFGQRVATQESAWKSFTVGGASVSAASVKKTIKGGKKTTIKSFDKTLELERKLELLSKKLSAR